VDVSEQVEAGVQAFEGGMNALAADNETQAREQLQQAVGHFQEARNQNRQDPQANLGYALTKLIDLLVRLRDRLAPEGSRSPGADVVRWGLRAPHPPALVRDLPALARELVQSWLAQPLEQMRRAASRQSDGGEEPTWAEVEAALRDYLQGVQEILAVLEIVRQSPNFEGLTLTVPREDGTGETVTLVLGPAEVELIEGLLYLTVGLANEALIYDWDTQGNEPPDLLKLIEADGDATPSEYFPAASFGVRQSDGVARGQAALAGYRDMVTHLDGAVRGFQSAGKIAGLNLVEAGEEPGPNEVPIGQQDLANAISYLAQLEALFAGRYVLDKELLHLDPDFPIEGLNVPATLNNPVADLRSIAPTFRRGEGDGVLVDFPEEPVSLGGLLDPAVPEEKLQPLLEGLSWGQGG